MNVKTLCLAILHNHEATGYQIRNLSINGKYGYFIEAGYNAIYHALADLEQDGFADCRMERSDGKPAKKVYAITDAGCAELIRLLSQNIHSDIMRSEFLLFARFAGFLPASLVKTRVEEHLADMNDKIASLNNLLAEEAREDESWVIRHAIRSLKDIRTDFNNHKHELIDLAQTGPTISYAKS